MRAAFVILCLLALLPALSRAQLPLSMEQLKSYPFPNELTASSSGARIAWAFNEQGQRNIYVAEGPAFSARRLSNYL